eukprot:CAMPEP_0117653064 /NCGR_PEP_ID=MMETSP0804-20121206/2987_1 /TAXON_ID=1074897 /ORGANISM="Tetraselmis astigmatica, Strain CCMP880" /LENGTH=141 /DNA_ID=CAMNT_0005459205 /DNA_START=169 /DNA_END=594 /DNA_ORIENTATION=-
MSAGFPSRGGLSSRQPLFGAPPPPAAGGSSVQVSIQQPEFNLDNEVTGLRGQMAQLKAMSQQIGESSRENSQILAGLEETMEKVRMTLKRSMKRMNKAYEQSKSNHLLYLILFSLATLFGLYFFAKVVGTIRWVFDYGHWA